MAQIQGTTVEEKPKKPVVAPIVKPRNVPGGTAPIVTAPSVLKSKPTAILDAGATKPTVPPPPPGGGTGGFTPTGGAGATGSSYVPQQSKAPQQQSTAVTGIPQSNPQGRPGPMQPETPIAPVAPVVPQQGQQDMTASAQQVGGTMDSVSALMKQVSAMGNEGLAAATAQMASMMSMLDQMEAQILGGIREQMNGDDPGMQSAIGLIKEEAKRLMDEGLQELNARGLVQSGVYAEMTTRLKSGELTEIQKMTSERFGDLQNQLNSAMMSLAQTRVGAMSQGNSNINSMLTNNMNTTASMGMQGIGLGLQERGQNMQNTQYYAGLGQQKELANMANTTQLYGINTSANTSKYGVDAQTAQSQAQLAQSAKQFGASYAQNASGQSLAQQKFDFDKKQYADSLNAYNTTNTSNQKAQASADAQQLVGSIKDGSMSYADAMRTIYNSPYAQDIQKDLLLYIQPYAPKHTSSPTPTGGTNNNRSGFTPTTPNNRRDQS